MRIIQARTRAAFSTGQIRQFLLLKVGRSRETRRVMAVWLHLMTAVIYTSRVAYILRMKRRAQVVLFTLSTDASLRWEHQCRRV